MFLLLSGIRKATAWYNSHISLARPPIRNQPKPDVTTAVLLTDDVANRQKAEAEGLHAFSGMIFWINHDYIPLRYLAQQVRRYVEGLKNSSQLLDLLSSMGEDIEPTRAAAPRQALYPDVSGSSTEHTHR